MAESEASTSRTRLALLTLVAFAGAADVAIFALTDPGTALKNPGRAAGTLAGLATWMALTAVSGARLGGNRTRQARRAALGLAALAALDGVGLAAIHLAAHVGGWRTLVGGAAGLAALGLAAASARD